MVENLRETDVPKHPGWCFFNLLMSVDLPTPEGPARTRASGRATGGGSDRPKLLRFSMDGEYFKEKCSERLINRKLFRSCFNRIWSRVSFGRWFTVDTTEQLEPETGTNRLCNFSLGVPMDNILHSSQRMLDSKKFFKKDQTAKPKQQKTQKLQGQSWGLVKSIKPDAV